MATLLYIVAKKNMGQTLEEAFLVYEMCNRCRIYLVKNA